MCGKSRLSLAEKEVNSYISVLCAYFEKCRLTLNIEKRESTVINAIKEQLYPNARTYIPSIFIGNRFIKYNNKIKRVGYRTQGKVSNCGQLGGRLNDSCPLGHSS